MTDASPGPRMLDAASAARWRAYLAAEERLTLPLDRTAVVKAMRANTIVLTACATVIAVSLLVAAMIALGVWGRGVTFVLFVVLAAATAAVFVKFVLVRGRLRALVASSDEYLAIDAVGLRVAGSVEIPWSAVVGGVGYDDRGGEVPLMQRPAARISRAAGEARAELHLGLRHARAWRDAADPRLRRMFVVNFDDGALRLPLDVALAGDAVLPALAAAWAAAEAAGVDVVLTTDRVRIRQAITDNLLGRAPGSTA